MLDFLVLGRVEDREVTAYQGTEGEYLKVNCAPIESHPPAQYSWVVTDSDEGTEHTEITEDERIFIDHEGKCDIIGLKICPPLIILTKLLNLNKTDQYKVDCV